MPHRDPAVAAPATERVRVRRAHQRGAYDRPAIDAVLDAGMLCHVAYVLDGAPVVTPTLYWREDDHVYWHGSSASRMLRMTAGAQVCLAVTHVDGLVVARSAFHHSVNYRSVMLFGVAEWVQDPAAKAHAVRRMVDQILPDRWDRLRPVTDQEMKATTVLRMPINEASVKIRTGPPVDDEEDYGLPIWAGVIPMRTVLDPPIADPRLAEATAGVPSPAVVADRLRTDRRD